MQTTNLTNALEQLGKAKYKSYTKVRRNKKFNICVVFLV